MNLVLIRSVNIMSFSFKLLSHCGEKFKGGQLLVDHLKGVSQIALDLHGQHGIKENIEEVIRTICMCHDFGKASRYFQEYLKGKYSGELKNHGEISAYFAYYMLPEDYKLMGFICIKRHHGHMENGSDIFSSDFKLLQDISNGIAEASEELDQIYGIDIDEFLRLIQDKKFLLEPLWRYKKSFGEYTVEDLIWVEYIWSLLLTSDKTQLIRGSSYENRSVLKEEHVRSYKNCIRRKLIEENSGIESKELFSIREKIYNEISEEIRKADIKKEHKFSINVPTGTGKTFGVYGAAFTLVERIYEESRGNIKPSVVYTLPFTSVIDQNYNELEKIMEYNGIKKYEDIILKHHSMSELRYITSETEEYKEYDARFCVENWQSTVIVTTFVQLFNTIFKVGDNSIGNRFHKLAGSIIILDEIQAVDPKFFKVIEEFFDVLCNKFNTYVILVTATKPVILEGKELVRHNEKYFRALNRILIENKSENKVSLEEFCYIVEKDINSNKDKSFLIVLNTVNSSLAVMDYLRKKCKARSVLYLSTEIYPKRRLEIIKMIREQKGKKYVVVSTQLIEAGVDVDFDVVYRDFCTMDSINQTAGRANRNGLNSIGLVKLYTIYDVSKGNRKYCNYIYPLSLLDVTKAIIRDKDYISESEIFDINNQYFKELNEIKSNDRSDDIIKGVRGWQFENIRKMFELIKENEFKVDLIVNINNDTQKCINKILAGNLGEQEMINCWRILNQYKVSINIKELNDILEKPYEDKNMRIISKEGYDINRGIRRVKNLIY